MYLGPYVSNAGKTYHTFESVAPHDCLLGHLERVGAGRLLCNKFSVARRHINTCTCRSSDVKTDRVGNYNQQDKQAERSIGRHGCRCLAPDVIETAEATPNTVWLVMWSRHKTSPLPGRRLSPLVTTGHHCGCDRYNHRTMCLLTVVGWSGERVSLGCRCTVLFKATPLTRQ